MSGPTPDDDSIFTLSPDAFRVADRTDAVTTPTPAPVPEPAPKRERSRPEQSEPPLPEMVHPKRRRKGWDIALTIVLLVLFFAVAAVGSFAGWLLGVAASSCDANVRVCRPELSSIGVFVAITVPWLIFVLSGFFAVVLLALRRRGWWMALLGMLLGGVAWLVGALLVWAGI